jgi:anti-sigma factor (TIGR02949 family)
MAELNDMACQELVELITDYLEDALSPEDRKRFEEHLAVCPDCRTYLAQMRVTIRLTGVLKEDAIPTELRKQLLGVLQQMKRRQLQ